MRGVVELRIVVSLALLCFLVVGSGICAEDMPKFFGMTKEEADMSAIKLEVSSIQNNRNIPSEYTCDGDDVSPEISWSGLPDGTESLALTVIDHDAPMGDFVHWLVYDIDPKAKSIPKAGPLPIGAKEVQNDFGKKTYGGPCPPQGTHRYFFTLYALDTKYLNDVTSANFLSLVRQHAIDSVDIVGLYRRSR